MYCCAASTGAPNTAARVPRLARDHVRSGVLIPQACPIAISLPVVSGPIRAQGHRVERIPRPLLH